MILLLGLKTSRKGGTEMRDEYAIELTDEEYELLTKLKEYEYKRLSDMSEKERLAYFRRICYEKDLNIEKEINGTVYKVNSYFSNTYRESIFTKISRIL